MGICVGLQALFHGSDENPAIAGLGIIPGQLTCFDTRSKSVPHIGWNSAIVRNAGNEESVGVSHFGLRPRSKYYYVHSYAIPYKEGKLESLGWTVATAKYGEEEFVGAVVKGNVIATQFHPEKSGAAGLRVLEAFLHSKKTSLLPEDAPASAGGLTRRVIACLDVRANDDGDLVVTKGDQYDVRDKSDGSANKDGTVTAGKVRNLGKPIDLAKRYYESGADEITFLNITSFRSCPVADLPMLEVLRQTSRSVFVPLTVGGGIRDTTNPDGTKIPAVDVARLYFESGADKVSIGSDAVTAAERYWERGGVAHGDTAIEAISIAYGAQAVVISVDPRRVYVKAPEDTKHHTIKTNHPGPDGEDYCWYQCTISGGREARDIDVKQVVKAGQALGAGEILLNCIDRDGAKSGFDIELINDVKEAVTIPVIASSGAGMPEHFEEVFQKTHTDAALGAGMVRL